MNFCNTVDICLNGITMSTDEYSLGHFSLSGNGNITSETVDGQTIRYKYDSHNRLTHYFDPIANRTRIYTYDDRGNILDVKYCGYMTEEEYTAFVAEYGVDTIPSFLYTYGDSTWADLLTNYSGTNITYDELGNPLNWVGGRGITLTWENGRQLKQYKRGSTYQYDYTYNADGLRTGKTVTQSGSVTKQTEYYIVNGQYIGEVSNIGGTEYVISYVYDENGSPAGINVNGSAYYFAKNLQGDIVAIMSYTGNVIAKYHYDAWGYLISITDANGATISSSTHIAKLNPFRYRGYMYDEESGFYYLRSRYYDPAVGRFLNADNVISGTSDSVNGYNQFAYCFNNPVNMDDASGNWPKWIKKAVKNVAKTIKKAVDSVEKKIRKVPVAFSNGQDLNFQLGNISAGGSISIVTHSNGDVLIQADLSLSVSTSASLGISSKTIKEVQFVPDFDSLHPVSSNLAVNATVPIPNTPISGDGSLCFKKYYSKNGKNMYPAFSVDVGAAYPAITNIEYGLSAGISQSYDIYEFNLFDSIDKWLIHLIEWE